MNFLLYFEENFGIKVPINMTATLSKNDLENQVSALNQELCKKDEKIICLEEQLAWFKRQIFGKRSERVVSDLNSQILYFEGFENLASKEEEKKNVVAHTRKKPDRNGQDKITLPENLPVKTTILDISEEEKVCQETGKPLVKIGVEVSHKLAHEPGSYYIKEIIRPKYAYQRKRREWDLNSSHA